MIVRLQERGWLHCESRGHAFRYRPAAPRELAQGIMVRKLLDAAFGGSAEGLVLALLDGHGLTPAESRRIREMIQRAEDSRAKRRGGLP